MELTPSCVKIKQTVFYFVNPQTREQIQFPGQTCDISLGRSAVMEIHSTFRERSRLIPGCRDVERLQESVLCVKH